MAEFEAMRHSGGGLWIGVWHPFVSGRLSRWLRIEKMMEYNPVWPVHRIAPTPLRIVLAERDEFIPPDLVRATYERAGEPKDLVVLSCGHLEVYNTEPWLTRASDAGIDWFKRYL